MCTGVLNIKTIAIRNRSNDPPVSVASRGASENAAFTRMSRGGAVPGKWPPPVINGSNQAFGLNRSSENDGGRTGLLIAFSQTDHAADPDVRGFNIAPKEALLSGRRLAPRQTRAVGPRQAGQASIFVRPRHARAPSIPALFRLPATRRD